MTVDATQGLELLLKVDGFQLSSLSLKRVRTYLGLLQNLVGKKSTGVHISSLKDGSLVAMLEVEPEDTPHVSAWLSAAGTPLSGEPRHAFEEFQKAIQKDGGRDASATIIDFKTKEIILTIAANDDEPEGDKTISQKDTLRGRIIALSETRNGSGYTGLIAGSGTPSRFTYEDSIAALLKPFLWTEAVELSGHAKWVRSPEGKWKLAKFEATSVTKLKQDSLKEIRSQIKARGGFRFKEENLGQFLKDIR
ncbi:hypothetical protein JK165_08980 [Acetobacter okinawensis]|uniref:hypothetical protein n=1 Tax=Acetobacter okinawensis TaxID=1076594 RepID=UPI001BA476B5|nr:hypothetical protein [Acetobacter okinawensis]MBS0966219.1 hypothetical protein [Acetobacter okinawensis]